MARHRHFTRAAEELHVTQSALSHQVRQLERELGTLLFERTSRRVVVTEAGRAVAARARRVLAELDGARQEVDELRGVLRGRIWVGPLLPAGEVDVPGLLARFSRAHPGIEVGLREGVAADMLRMLGADELDAAFCLLSGDPPDDLAAELLSDEEVVVAFAPDRAPPEASITVADLAPHVIVAPRRGSAITSAMDTALRRRRPVAPTRPGERRPLPPAHARRPRVRRGDPAPVTHQPRGPAGGGAKPAPSGVSARGARLASHAHHLTGGARVHRVRPPRRRARRRRSAAGWCRGPSTCTGPVTTPVR